MARGCLTMPAGSALEADTPCLLEVGPRGALLMFQAVTEGGTGAATGVGPTQQENSAEYTGRVGARRDGGGGGGGGARSTCCGTRLPRGERIHP